MKSKPQSCYGCRLFDGRSNCLWFNPKKLIPLNIIDKGCKLYKSKHKNIKTTKLVRYIIKIFDGEII